MGVAFLLDSKVSILGLGPFAQLSNAVMTILDCTHLAYHPVLDLRTESCNGVRA